MSDVDVIKLLNAEKVKKNIEQEKRIDNRDLLEMRPLKIERGVIKSADGSARARLGDTEVIAGIKFAIGTPYPDSPDEGSIVVNFEMSGIASADLYTGPPSIEAMEYGRVVDRVIRSSDCIDFKKLSIVSGEKSFIIYIDCYTMNADGNLIDATQYAAMAALLDAKLPKLDENNNIIIKEYTSKKLDIDLTKIPISFTFGKYKDKIFIDPTETEELAIETRFTLGVCKDDIVAYHKGGREGTFKIEDITKIMDIASSKYLEVKTKISDKK